MARSYSSTVFDHPADRVWSVIRDFNSYAVWVDGPVDSHIEDGRSGDSVGAIRNVRMGDVVIRQRLLAHSDLDRSLSYEFCPPARHDVRNFRATLRVTPVTEGDRAFLEWWATFDCTEEEHDRWIAFFSTPFAGWLASLSAYLARTASGSGSAALPATPTPGAAARQG